VTNDQGSISPTINRQHLRVQIPKALKDTYNLTEFLRFLGSLHIKAAHKMLMKLTPGYNPVKHLVLKRPNES